MFVHMHLFIDSDFWRYNLRRENDWMAYCLTKRLWTIPVFFHPLPLFPSLPVHLSVSFLIVGYAFKELASSITCLEFYIIIIRSTFKSFVFCKGKNMSQKSMYENTLMWKPSQKLFYMYLWEIICIQKKWNNMKF